MNLSVLEVKAVEDMDKSKCYFSLASLLESLVIPPHSLTVLPDTLP